MDTPRYITEHFSTALHDLSRFSVFFPFLIWGNTPVCSELQNLDQISRGWESDVGPLNMRRIKNTKEEKVFIQTKMLRSVITDTFALYFTDLIIPKPHPIFLSFFVKKFFFLKKGGGLLAAHRYPNTYSSLSLLCICFFNSQYKAVRMIKQTWHYKHFCSF